LKAHSFFGSSTAVESHVNKALNIKTMIIDISGVPFLDITAMFTLKDLHVTLQHSGVEVIIVASHELQQELFKLDRAKTFRKDKFFTSLEDAVRQL